MDARGETHGMKKPLKAAACIPTGGKLRNHVQHNSFLYLVKKQIEMYKNEVIMTKLISLQNNKYLSHFSRTIDLYFSSTDFYFYSKTTIIKGQMTHDNF